MQEANGTCSKFARLTGFFPQGSTCHNGFGGGDCRDASGCSIHEWPFITGRALSRRSCLWVICIPLGNPNKLIGSPSQAWVEQFLSSVIDDLSRITRRLFMSPQEKSHNTWWFLIQPSRQLTLAVTGAKIRKCKVFGRVWDVLANWVWMGSRW